MEAEILVRHVELLEPPTQHALKKRLGPTYVLDSEIEVRRFHGFAVK
jgi:hypothetical protein